MPKISDDVIRAVQDAAKIEDVVSDFVTLRRAGVNLTGLCPFHNDKHDGNFIVRPSTVSKFANTYHCFTCMGVGEGGGPVDFLMKAEHMSFPDAIRYLGRKYCIPVDDVPVNWVPPPPRPVPPPLPRLTFKRETVRESLKGIEQTLFVKYLRSLPWDEQQRARLTDVLHLYCVASCPHGPEWVSFWQITDEGTPLTAKYMKYQPNGHRVKDRDEQGNKVFATDWEHAWRARKKQYDESKYDTSGRALFGCHLLKRYPRAHVNIVESEKTALIMANYFGDLEHHLWLAVGGLKWLKIESMQPLIDQGRLVWLWPDKDGATSWQEVADKLGSDHVQVYTRFFDTCWIPEDGEKADVADIAIRMMKHPEFRPRQTQDKDGGGCGATGDGLDGSPGESVGTPPADLPITEEQMEMLGIKEWAAAHPDEPIIDPAEPQDPRVRGWRETLRQRYNFNKSKHDVLPKN